MKMNNNSFPTHHPITNKLIKESIRLKCSSGHPRTVENTAFLVDKKLRKSGAIGLSGMLRCRICACKYHAAYRRERKLSNPKIPITNAKKTKKDQLALLSRDMKQVKKRTPCLSYTKCEIAQKCLRGCVK